MRANLQKNFEALGRSVPLLLGQTEQAVEYFPTNIQRRAAYPLSLCRVTVETKRSRPSRGASPIKPVQQGLRIGSMKRLWKA